MAALETLLRPAVGQSPKAAQWITTASIFIALSSDQKLLVEKYQREFSDRVAEIQPTS